MLEALRIPESIACQNSKCQIPAEKMAGAGLQILPRVYSFRNDRLIRDRWRIDPYSPEHQLANGHINVPFRQLFASKNRPGGLSCRPLNPLNANSTPYEIYYGSFPAEHGSANKHDGSCRGIASTCPAGIASKYS